MINTDTQFMLSCTEFFYQKLLIRNSEITSLSEYDDELRYYLYAFISAARSTTFYMNVEFTKINGYKQWWEEKRLELDDGWNKVRVMVQHISPPKLHESIVFKFNTTKIQVSPNITVEEPTFDGAETYLSLKHFDKREPFLKLCEVHLSSLIRIVNECHEKFC